MGCEFNYEKLNAQNEADAVEEVKSLIRQAAYDHGHAGYTGSFAEAERVKVKAPIGVQPDDAEEWLYDHCHKWGAALIIKDAVGGFHAGAQCSS